MISTTRTFSALVALLSASASFAGPVSATSPVSGPVTVTTPALPPPPGPITAPPADPTVPDDPDASACNGKTVGSIVVTAVNKVVMDTCTGTDCLHNNISVPYASQSLTGQMAYVCKAYPVGDERNPTYQYLWDIYCQATHSVSSQCQPKLMPCPKCKPTDLTSYWARPDLLVLSDASVDTCKGLAAFRSTAGAALYAAAVAKSAKAEAERAASFATSIVIGAKGPFKAPVCIADPAL